MSAPIAIDIATRPDLWLEAIQHLNFWLQMSVLLVAAPGALLVHRAVGPGLLELSQDNEESALRGLALKTIQRILFPISMLLGVLAGRVILGGLGYPVGLLDIAIPLLTSMATIRIAVYFLRKTFQPGAAVKAWENLISSSVWIVVALHLLGWLPAVLTALDDVAMQFGQTRVSLLAVIKLMLALACTWVLALWIARRIEQRLLRSEYVNAGMQVALIKLSKFVLLTLSLLVALDAVGIDLTTLKVFGGALGVGLGFGLQRIASNFISGFIVLFDRSIRPGDVITIRDKFGWVQELHARYAVVRDREGVDWLIPNESLITSEVVNWSYGDRNVRVKIPVSISYDNDPEQALALMLACAKSNARVLDDPAPATRLLNFGDNGIELELRVWINDPENGMAAVRSDINLAIWQAFKAAGIVIPYPQRDLHLKGDWEALAAVRSD